MDSYYSLENMSLDEILALGEKVYRFPLREPANGTLLWCTDGVGHNTGYYLFPPQLAEKVIEWSSEPEEYCLQYFEFPLTSNDEEK